MKASHLCLALALSAVTLCAVSLSGCDTPQEREIKVQYNLKNPGYLGKLDDGRVVRVVIVNNDRLYIIDNATVVASEQFGKVRQSVTTVSPSVADIEKLVRLKAERATIQHELDAITAKEDALKASTNSQQP